ncbi:tyrosine-protein phosphatase [Nocardia neocaledoniensis]|uniref:tyrosine-protein phosphatase n=1 Tax=Nocardia neocaledoniensis TaxID=236511 RepID=UPI002458457A|nr:tyrosine-protein phosphatase [Nocardia neocaledoniensis]
MTDTVCTVPNSLANLRDVASTSGLLRPGVLLRSDAPLVGDNEVYDVAWPPKRVVDLRDRVEGGTEGHPLADRAEVIEIPLLAGGATDFERAPQTLGELYGRLLSPPLARLVVDAVTAVATADGTTLVHCTAGKDRTGVVVAVTLRLAGIPRDRVLADYARTAATMAAVHARMQATFLHTKAGADRKLPDGIAAGFLGVDVQAMSATLTTLSHHRGGPSGWFTEHGGSPRIIDLLRARLLA